MQIKRFVCPQYDLEQHNNRSGTKKQLIWNNKTADLEQQNNKTVDLEQQNSKTDLEQQNRSVAAVVEGTLCPKYAD
ncbi:hypothetical protein K1719_002649 [Acacia pycnantha]|nr:hypothetical protein K1719_002649 [Acacia pycnantha]